MNIKAIARNVGFALLASAFFMFLSILVSMRNGNDSALAAFLISFTITFIFGIFPFIFVRKTPDISLKDGYVIIVLSWILSFIFGMLPYLLWGGPFSVINAFFESVSGYTTTGATILENIEQLPDSILFWRSSTHFIGGLGVVVFLLLIIPSSNPVRLRLTNMELSSLSREGYKSRANKTVWIFTTVYLGLNVAAFLSYLLCGMGAFDAINHAFSVCATGGFSTRNESIGAFASPAVNFVSMLFMFLSATHFGIIFMVFASRSLKPLNNPVLKLFASVTVIAAIFLAIVFKCSGETSWLRSVEEGFFHSISYITTTGFAISDNSRWPLFACVLMTFLSIQCGMAGSTTGGIKCDRFYLLFKSIGQQINRITRPSTVSVVTMGRHTVSLEEMYPHLVYIAMYFLLIGLSMVLAILFGLDAENALTASVSSIGNVGPAMNELGNFGNYGSVPNAAKVLFCADMFLGRLEIYPVLTVFMMSLGRLKK